MAFSHDEHWTRALAHNMPVLGHRNWIAVVDSAYPDQVSPGVNTLLSNKDQLSTLREVIMQLDHAKHVRPIFYLDSELDFLDDVDTPGISAYRQELKKIFGERLFKPLPHEQIIKNLDQAGQTFRVIVIKSDMTLPYTSVFIELNCGYWNADGEQRMRDRMATG